MKQAFDNVSPVNLSLVMKEMAIDLVLARAILREQIGGKYDSCFPETRSHEYPSTNPSNREGKRESVPVQSDDEECLQDNTRKMVKHADGFQDKRK